MNQILPGLFLSDWESSDNPNLLEQNKIGAVIMIETRPKKDEVITHYKNKGIDFRFFYLGDHPDENISQYFDESSEYIRNSLKNGKNVLVHCYAGISRSPTLVINYILDTVKHAEVESALEYVRSRRPVVDPNHGFLNQLKMKSSHKKMDYGNISGSVFEQPPQMMQLPTNTEQIPDEVKIADFEKEVIPLGNSNFDDQGNIVNFPDACIVLFYSPGCGHCTNMKPDYAVFARGAHAQKGFKVCGVDASKNRDLLGRINPQVWKYKVSGFPMIVGYIGGKFYSEYGMDDPKKFRKVEDLVEYAQGLGKAPITKERGR